MFFSTQARLREQLMVEKESRLLEMAARQEAAREGTIQRVTRSSASSLSSSLSSLNSSGAGQGRVRKMFEERRNGYNNHHSSPVGWDKSYPLEPVGRNGYGQNYQQRNPSQNRGGKMKGVVRSDRGVSMDRGPVRNDSKMIRSRSQVTMQRNNMRNDENRFQHQGRSMKPPKPTNSRIAPHHKSTSSLLDNNHLSYNGSKSSDSGSYSRDPSPAPSPVHNKFGFRNNGGMSNGYGSPNRNPPSPMRSVPASRRPVNNSRFAPEDDVDYGRNVNSNYDHERIEQWARTDARRVSENRPKSFELANDRYKPKAVTTRRSSIDQYKNTRNKGFLSHNPSLEDEEEQENTPPPARPPPRAPKVSLNLIVVLITFYMKKFEFIFVFNFF